jgi:acyl-CoA oxidase
LLFVLTLHAVTTVREQASEEQKAYWMPKIENHDIIGCYAQTELGHGSNVRGLETYAKWDPVKKEFEIHSPYLTASKWWNGTMGRTATHAVGDIHFERLNTPLTAADRGSPTTLT